MSTKVKDRNESPIEYIECSKKLFATALKYLPQLGVKNKTLLQESAVNVANPLDKRQIKVYNI